MHDLAWPVEHLGDALIALARHAGLRAHDVAIATPQSREIDDRWLTSAAQVIGVDVERKDIAVATVQSVIEIAAPALVPVGGTAAATHVLAIAGRRKLLTPQRRVIRVSAARWRALVCDALEAGPSQDAERALTGLAISADRQQRARAQMVAVALATTTVPVWMVSLPVSAPLAQLFRHHRLGPRVATLIAAHTAYLTLWMLAWWLIGVGALGGHLDRGWMLAWMLLLATLVPVRMTAQWAEARVAIIAGALLKQRLLLGALRLDPERVSGEGAGALLGRALESDTVESLALTGGFTAIVSVLELIGAGAALGSGYSLWAVLPLAAWCALAAAFVHQYWTHGQRWATSRTTMTHALVERMVGHRTRLAQQAAHTWHHDEDRELDAYVGVSKERDRAEARLLALLPQGWLVIGLLTIAPAFLGDGLTAAALAAALGGIVLATRAFHRLAGAFWQIVDARIAWLQVAPLMHAVDTAPPAGSAAGIAAVAAADTAHASGIAVSTALTARGLSYRYPDRAAAVLQDASLDLHPGDKAVLAGISGGGKSTFASLVAGLRSPNAGLLLSGGLDRATIGADGWRRRVAMAPQFHQNHVISGPLSFNLLMGRGERFSPDDYTEAQAICEELGLGGVIARMPGGLQQMVGETGWQLSQGERSRVFIARALLQRASVVVLDESFAALDPHTMDQVLACVTKRAPSLLVIAHR